MGQSKKPNRFSAFRIVSAVASIVVLVVSGLVSDRVTGWGNKMIDGWLAAHQGEVLAWILDNPFNLISSFAVMILLIIAWDWYSGTKKPNRQKEVPEEKKILKPSIETTSSAPAIVKRFSRNLEKIKKEGIKAGWEITGIGLGFLDKIKTAPPFLGLSHDKPIISPLHEKELTEFFQSSIYMEKYRDVIKGGRHTIRDGENDRKIIAKVVYGRESHAYYVPERVTYPTGLILELPYLNLTRTDQPDDIKRIIAKSKELEGIISILESYNLTRREAIPLLRIVYDAAQKTLYERKK